MCVFVCMYMSIIYIYIYTDMYGYVSTHDISFRASAVRTALTTDGGS